MRSVLFSGDVAGCKLVRVLNGNITVAGAELPGYPPKEEYYWQAVRLKQSV